MLFNKSRKWDFPPEISFSNNENLEYLYQIKLVGIIVSDDLRWEKNTQYICRKETERMWILRRMKKSKLDTEILLDTYTKEIRTILELAVPVWHSGLTLKQTRDIERIQKTALYIILEESYLDYDVACTLLGIEPLNLRRDQLCLKFAKKDVKKENSLFTKTENNGRTRQNNPVKEPKCNSIRFFKSRILYLSKLLNNDS